MVFVLWAMPHYGHLTLPKDFCSIPRFGIEMLSLSTKPKFNFGRKAFVYPQTNNMQEPDPLLEHA